MSDIEIQTSDTLEIIDEVKPELMKKSRGRPKKGTVNNKLKLKKGKDPNEDIKYFEEYDNILNLLPKEPKVQEEEPKEKRPRGRPRKIIIEPVEPKPKKKMGRPRKIILEEPIKNPKGRPFKVFNITCTNCNHNIKINKKNIII